MQENPDAKTSPMRPTCQVLADAVKVLGQELDQGVTLQGVWECRGAWGCMGDSACLTLHGCAGNLSSKEKQGLDQLESLRYSRLVCKRAGMQGYFHSTRLFPFHQVISIPPGLSNLLRVECRQKSEGKLTEGASPASLLPTVVTNHASFL